MAKSIVKSGPCTVSAKPTDKVRGGKGFEARYQAMLAEQARHASLYCGAASYSIAGMAIGRGAASSHIAAVSVWQGSGCAETGYGWHTIAYSARFIGTTPAGGWKLA